MTLVLPGSRLLHLLEAALALWVAAWTALGVAVAVNVKQLATLSETVEGRPRGGDGRRVAALLGSVPPIAESPKLDSPRSSSSANRGCPLPPTIVTSL